MIDQFKASMSSPSTKPNASTPGSAFHQYHGSGAGMSPINKNKSAIQSASKVDDLTFGGTMNTVMNLYYT